MTLIKEGHILRCLLSNWKYLRDRPNWREAREVIILRHLCIHKRHFLFHSAITLHSGHSNLSVTEMKSVAQINYVMFKTQDWTEFLLAPYWRCFLVFHLVSIKRGKSKVPIVSRKVILFLFVFVGYTEPTVGRILGTASGSVYIISWYNF